MLEKIITLQEQTARCEIRPFAAACVRVRVRGHARHAIGRATKTNERSKQKTVERYRREPGRPSVDNRESGQT